MSERTLVLQPQGGDGRREGAPAPCCPTPAGRRKRGAQRAGDTHIWVLRAQCRLRGRRGRDRNRRPGLPPEGASQAGPQAGRWSSAGAAAARRRPARNRGRRAASCFPSEPEVRLEPHALAADGETEAGPPLANEDSGPGQGGDGACPTQGYQGSPGFPLAHGASRALLTPPSLAPVAL